MPSSFVIEICHRLPILRRAVRHSARIFQGLERARAALPAIIPEIVSSVDLPMPANRGRAYFDSRA